MYFCESCGHKVVGNASAEAHRELGHVVRLTPGYHSSA